MEGASKFTQVAYWQCPQNPEHIYESDDWRVLPDENSTGWRGTYARCPKDGRELGRKTAVIGG